MQQRTSINLMKLTRCILLLTAVVGLPLAASAAVEESLSLRETVSPSALHDARSGPLRICGTVRGGSVQIRAMTGLGISSQASVASRDGKFECRYPDDFAGAGKLLPGVLFIDATTNAGFEIRRPENSQAEITVIVHQGKAGVPELPSGFTTDLLDNAGRRDQASAEWPRIRALVNLYMHSRAARLVRTGRENFDLDRDADLAWFKNNLSLYEFDYRDRDWSQPLGHRVARTFWQAVWNKWFGFSNDHPLDGNPKNKASTNYLPYTFANDYSDILIMEWMRLQSVANDSAHQTNLCREATRNLLAMQHRTPDNFALPEAGGKRETYTAGAFRYGMFENGEFMTEGKGWFYNPKFRDFEHGGVMNGRAVWGLGEALRHDSRGPLAASLRDSMRLALKFCLHDGVTGRYVKKTRAGNWYWRDPGEHAYLVLGMLAACAVDPKLEVKLDENTPPTTLRKLCVTSLNALADLEKPTHQWTSYPNIDAVAVAALAEGAQLLPGEPSAQRWREVAVRVTDAWLAAKVNPQECAGAPVHFGLRLKPGQMTYVWPSSEHPQFFYYQSGHWIQALASLYDLTGDARYRQRAEAMVGYLCGNNPWQVRLFNELGGVYNSTSDTDGDGLQDRLRQDMYPESTAFCQIGIMRLWQAICAKQ